jgi:hypothetical protein
MDNQSTTNQTFSEEKPKYTIEGIAQIMRIGKGMAPEESAKMRVYLAGEYAYLSSCLENILAAKPDMWILIRENKKSDSQADAEWNRTKEGRNEMIMKLRLKRIEKMMSALRTYLEMAEKEINYFG